MSKAKPTPPKPTPPSAKAIEDDLAASLRALGIDARHARSDVDLVFDAYLELARELRRPPQQTEVAQRSGVHETTVCHIAKELAAAGRLLRLATGSRKASYVPNMTRI